MSVTVRTRSGNLKELNLADGRRQLNGPRRDQIVSKKLITCTNVGTHFCKKPSNKSAPRGHVAVIIRYMIVVKVRGGSICSYALHSTATFHTFSEFRGTLRMNKSKGILG